MFHVKRARGEDEQDPREAGEPPGLAWGNPTAPAREKPTGPASRGYSPAPAGVAGALCPVTPMPEVDLPRPGDRSRRTVARARASAGPAPGRGGTPALGWREGPRPSGAAPWAHRKARARRTGCSGDGYGLPDRGRLGSSNGRPRLSDACHLGGGPLGVDRRSSPSADPRRLGPPGMSIRRPSPSCSPTSARLRTGASPSLGRHRALSPYPVHVSRETCRWGGRE